MSSKAHIDWIKWTKEQEIKRGQYEAAHRKKRRSSKSGRERKSEQAAQKMNTQEEIEEISVTGKSAILQFRLMLVKKLLRGMRTWVNKVMHDKDVEREEEESLGSDSEDSEEQKEREKREKTREIKLKLREREKENEKEMTQKSSEEIFGSLLKYLDSVIKNVEQKQKEPCKKKQDERHQEDEECRRLAGLLELVELWALDKMVPIHPCIS